MKPLILLPRAEVDVFDAAIWYETQREGLGQEFMGDFDHLVSRIRNSPFQFPALESDARRAMLDRFPYGVFFLVEDETVVVFAVLHLHREPGAWRSRR
jgi:toxin ParE1/3/4